MYDTAKRERCEIRVSRPRKFVLSYRGTAATKECRVETSRRDEAEERIERLVTQVVEPRGCVYNYVTSHRLLRRSPGTVSAGHDRRADRRRGIARTGLRRELTDCDGETARKRGRGRRRR